MFMGCACARGDLARRGAAFCSEYKHISFAKFLLRRGERLL
jgi:hypothetical protein